MKTRLLSVLAVSAMIGLLAGCTSFRSSVPQITEVPMGAISTTATYDIIGEAVGTASGTYLFGCIPVGVEHKTGFIVDSRIRAVGRVAVLRSRVESVAIYNAIESVPGTDAIIVPRWHIETAHHLFWWTVTATVKGKAVRYNVSAK